MPRTRSSGCVSARRSRPAGCRPRASSGPVPCPATARRTSRRAASSGAGSRGCRPASARTSAASSIVASVRSPTGSTADDLADVDAGDAHVGVAVELAGVLERRVDAVALGLQRRVCRRGCSTRTGSARSTRGRTRPRRGSLPRRGACVTMCARSLMGTPPTLPRTGLSARRRARLRQRRRTSTARGRATPSRARPRSRSSSSRCGRTRPARTGSCSVFPPGL